MKKLILNKSEYLTPICLIARLLLVLLRGAGTGGLGLAIEGPSEAKMSCKDNKDGSCSVEYIPFTPGEYDVNINFGGLPIPGCASNPSYY